MSDAVRAEIAALGQDSDEKCEAIQKAEEDARTVGIGFTRRVKGGRAEYLPVDEVVIHRNTISVDPFLQRERDRAWNEAIDAATEWVKLNVCCCSESHARRLSDRFRKPEQAKPKEPNNG